MEEIRPAKIRYVASVRRKSEIGSKLIVWGTKDLQSNLEPCSHLAIIVRDTLVIESTLSTGVRIMPYSRWLEINKVVHNFEKEYSGRLSDYLPSILDRMWGKKYDYTGIFYFAHRILMKKVFGAKLPQDNKWECKKRRFCVEIFGDKLSMVSPIQMVAKWDKDPTLTRL